jgi:hypothetical protein
MHPLKWIYVCVLALLVAITLGSPLAELFGMF